MKSAILACARSTTLAIACVAPACAAEFPPAPQATYETLFTPGDAIDRRLVKLIDAAREEVLVQAFTFTSRRIGNALIAAHARGVRVQVLADRGQTLELPPSRVPELARVGVAVWLDDRFASAHNKVIVIDAATTNAVVITGSYNYTVAAQTRNAENVLIVRHDPRLAASYRANFEALRDGAKLYTNATIRTR